MTSDINEHTSEAAGIGGVVSRRQIISAVAIVGAGGGVAGLVGAQQARTIRLRGRTSGWVGVAPAGIEGQTNPALTLKPRTDYTVMWTNADGQPHNFVIEDADGNDIVRSEIISRQGQSQTVKFTATKAMAEYYCEVHPQSMRGNVRVGSGGMSGAMPTETEAESDRPRVYHAHLTGEPHGVETKASGAARFAVNEARTKAQYELVVENIRNVTQAHIHLGRKGEDGPVVVWLYPKERMEPKLVEGRFSGTLAKGTITKDDFVGKWEGTTFENAVATFDKETAYVNVHTKEHPGGEIRGQIMPPHE